MIELYNETVQPQSTFNSVLEDKPTVYFFENVVFDIDGDTNTDYVIIYRFSDDVIVQIIEHKDPEDYISGLYKVKSNRLYYENVSTSDFKKHILAFYSEKNTGASFVVKKLDSKKYENLEPLYKLLFYTEKY